MLRTADRHPTPAGSPERSRLSAWTRYGVLISTGVVALLVLCLLFSLCRPVSFALGGHSVEFGRFLWQHPTQGPCYLARPDGKAVSYDIETILHQPPRTILSWDIPGTSEWGPDKIGLPWHVSVYQVIVQ